MNLLQVAVALGIPWLAGTLTVRAMVRGTVDGVWALALGYGYCLGWCMVVALLRLQMALDTAPDWRSITLCLAFMALVSGGLVQRRGGFAIRWQHWSSRYWQRALYLLLLAWLSWRYSILAEEVWLRPVFPWDAWGTWEVRSRVWAELQQWVAFIDPPRWLSTPDSYTVHAWEYPYAVSLIALWPTLALGNWYEPVAHLPWLGLGLALSLGLYGQWRYWGVGSLTALIGLWLLTSLPLLNTHIALAGYADLWLAAVFGLGAVALLQWTRTSASWQGILALLFALACPWIKREGLVWAALLVPSAAMVWIPRRYWLALFLAMILALTAWWVNGGVIFTVPGWGEVRLTPQVLQVPILGRFQWEYHDIALPLANNLFILSNWHLFSYLVASAWLLNIRYASAGTWQGAGLVLTSAGFVLLFLLFFCTEAYVWATQYTSVNRILLHFTPILLFWALVVILDAQERCSLKPPLLP